MSVALKRETNDQSYRLARKTMLDSLAAMTESATRVAGEPSRAKSMLPDLAGLLSAAYSLAAQIVGIRVLLNHRLADIDPAFADRLLAQSRAIVLGQLDLSQQADDHLALTDDDDATADAEKALQLRCAELCRDAVKLHEVAALFLP